MAIDVYSVARGLADNYLTDPSIDGLLIGTPREFGLGAGSP